MVSQSPKNRPTTDGNGSSSEEIHHLDVLDALDGDETGGSLLALGEEIKGSEALKVAKFKIDDLKRWFADLVPTLISGATVDGEPLVDHLEGLEDLTATIMLSNGSQVDLTMGRSHWRQLSMLSVFSANTDLRNAFEFIINYSRDEEISAYDMARRAEGNSMRQAALKIVVDSMPDKYEKFKRLLLPPAVSRGDVVVVKEKPEVLEELPNFVEVRLNNNGEIVFGDRIIKLKKGMVLDMAGAEEHRVEILAINEVTTPNGVIFTYRIDIDGNERSYMVQATGGRNLFDGDVKMSNLKVVKRGFGGAKKSSVETAADRREDAARAREEKRERKEKERAAIEKEKALEKVKPVYSEISKYVKGIDVEVDEFTDLRNWSELQGKIKQSDIVAAEAQDQFYSLQVAYTYKAMRIYMREIKTLEDLRAFVDENDLYVQAGELSTYRPQKVYAFIRDHLGLADLELSNSRGLSVSTYYSNYSNFKHLFSAFRTYDPNVDKTPSKLDQGDFVKFQEAMSIWDDGTIISFPREAEESGRIRADEAVIRHNNPYRFGR